MTRFARASGSKASNEKVPEQATPWSEMKQQLVNKQNPQSKTAKHKSENIEEQQSVSNRAVEKPQWADFPCLNQNKTGKKSKKRKFANKETNSSAEQKHNVNNQSENTVDTSDVKVSKKKKYDNKQAHEDESKQFKKKSKGEIASTSKTNKEKRENTNAKSISNGKFRKNNRDFKNNKKVNDGIFKRRKPFTEGKIAINGREVEIAHFDGFPIKKEDAVRLAQLRKDMMSKGISRSEIQKAMKLERRRAEKALAREKKKVCFNCRLPGHTISECPTLMEGPNAEMIDTGICFKCGSTQHTYFQCKVTQGDNFKFAQCFICKERGHISRQCPNNDRGIYPKGGSCKLCGDVTHLWKNCPQQHLEKGENKIVAQTMDGNVEALENENVETSTPKPSNLPKIIKF